MSAGALNFKTIISLAAPLVRDALGACYIQSNGVGMKVIIIIVVVVIALIAFGWLGLQISPKPFAAFPQKTSGLDTMPLPDGLPVPVDRFYRQIYGERVPLVESAVISGRARLRVNGITFPARFRFIHQAGHGYRHYIEATIFGLPLMKVSEHYLDGVSRMELPFGVTEDEPKVNQAANLALWAEAMWFPSILITDPQVRWKPVDNESAILVVPFGKAEERFIVRFDPDTGLLDIMESMRYKGAESEAKTLWLNQAISWDDINGSMIPAVGAVTWFDEGTPWAVFTVEALTYNADVRYDIRSSGP
jgi:hypothetical protein